MINQFVSLTAVAVLLLLLSTPFNNLKAEPLPICGERGENCQVCTAHDDKCDSAYTCNEDYRYYWETDNEAAFYFDIEHNEGDRYVRMYCKFLGGFHWQNTDRYVREDELH